MKENQPKILLIEDEPDIAEMYEIAFKGNGFEFESALTGEEARKIIQEIEQGKRSKPDFILLDLILPDISGVDVLKAIRSCEATKTIPVDILSNYASEQIKESVQGLEVDEYILKVDVTPQQLAERIKKKLGV